jgi:hypothetical protein
MVLDGGHAKNMVTRGDQTIFKIGFSRDPQSRLQTLNCFYPKPDLLRWRIEAEQWHSDPINAYAMEQHALNLVHNSQAKHLVGEIYEGRLADAVSAFVKAKRDAVRPDATQLPDFVPDLMF